MIFSLLFLVNALEFSLIPPTGPPPNRRHSSASVYDPYKNQLISFGGYDAKLQEITSSLNAFDLSTGLWSDITPQSSLLPPSLKSSYAYLRSDSCLLIFFGNAQSGLSSAIYSFNLLTYSWNIETLIGDQIEGRIDFSSTSFTYLGTTYVGIFGGLTLNGRSNDLYLINVNTLQAELMGKNGDVPQGILIGSLAYYTNALYLFGYYWPESSLDTEKQTLYRYDLDLRTWSKVQVSEKPEKRSFHIANVYNDEMYILYGAIIETSIIQDSIWKFNFSSNQWHFVSEVKGDGIVNSGIAVNGSIMYMVFGRNPSAFNSIYSIDFSENPPKKTLLSQNWESPDKRMNHCNFLSNDKILIFGGISDENTHLNDMWSFDITNNYWTYITTTGDIPEPRQLAGYTKIFGSSVVIFGGTDMSIIFNDMHFYQADQSLWRKIIPLTSNIPSPRYSSCIVNYGYNMIILGGRNDMELFNDIWMYDYLESEYFLLNSFDKVKIDLVNFNCWIDTDDGIVIYTIGGRAANDEPNNIVYKVEVLNSNNVFYTRTSSYYTASMNLNSEADIIVSGDSVYLLFGSQWRYMTYPLILEFNYKKIYETLWEFSSDISLYGHTAVHYKDSIYIFGGGVSLYNLEQGSSASNRLYKITRSENTLKNLQCSDGTAGNNCTPCPEGYYYSENECTPCPPGRYSKLIASTSISQCFPCPFGTYNSKSGNNYCIDCTSLDYCPIGSAEPLKITDFPIYQSTQPNAYTGKTKFITDMTGNLWYFFLSIGLFITFIGLLHCKLWETIVKVDIFVDQHDQDLNVPVIYRKTQIGGLFTIFYIIAAIITVTSSLMTYYLDNITETKSLIPLITLDQHISADVLYITISFYVYGADCVTNSQCNKANEFFESGFNFASKNVDCSKIGNICTVRIAYYDFSLTGPSHVYVQMKEDSVSVSGMTIVVECSSSIPGETSKIFFPISSGSDLKVFVGSTPTVVTYELTPSLFQSESSKWPSQKAGYHIAAYTDISLGSLNTVETINSDVMVLLTLSLTISNTGLVTLRTINNTFLMFIGSMLGAVFGLMGSFASVMTYTEGFVDKGKYKYNQNQKIKKITQSRKSLANELQKKNFAKNLRKITPLEFTIIILSPLWLFSVGMGIFFFQYMKKQELKLELVLTTYITDTKTELLTPSLN